ncbi:MAG TPA: protoporphyrinogen oxidase [Myxococcota bacterium]|nr:protoporphyrinogen oxidase [Myxococcota bacterium]
MGSSDIDVAVLGAGIAGLAAALELRAAGRDVVVLEAEAAPGGVLRTERTGGYTIERGPNLFRVSGEADTFLARHGAAGVLLPAGPESGVRSLLVRGHLVEAPASLAGAIATPLLSARGKLRVLAEPFVPRGSAQGESVAEFVARRLGVEALERAVAPALVGVYAGDETQLGAEAVFPALTAYERSHGSIARGALAAARAARRAGTHAARRGSWSTREGTAGLARALAERLGGAIALGTAARALAKDGGGFAIETDGGTRRARALIVALPAFCAADLLRSLDVELAEGLARIAYAPLASLALALDPPAMREPVRGIGFLVPRAEGLELLGALFPSRVFPDRAPAGRELAAALLGGARWPGAVDAPDDALLARAHAGLDRALGLRGAPELLGVARWPRAVPQPGREHPRLVADLRARAARLGALRLAGGYLDGVAVAAALVSGVRAAAELPA